VKDFLKNLFRKYSPNGVKHHTVTIDGSRIHWVEAGDPEKPTLLCVDGWMGSWKAFKRVIPHLKKDYHVVIFDLPGFGESDPLSSRHTVASISEFLRKFVQEIGLKRFHLLGLSFGAAVSLHFAANNSEMVDKVVLQGAPFDSKLFKLWMRLGARLMTLPVFIRAAEFIFGQEFLVFLVLRAQKDMAFATDEELWEKANRTGRASARAAMESAQDVTRIDLRKEAKLIKSSTLIIDGENVQFRPLAAWKILRELIPNSDLVLIKDATHTVPSQKPKEFSKEVLRFLKA